jgi:hypothetical protein
LTLEDGTKCGPEMSVSNHFTPRTNPEDGRIQTLWHFESKERFGIACVVRHEVRHVPDVFNPSEEGQLVYLMRLKSKLHISILIRPS